ncbi:LysR family transcriptional regulator [Roseomonas sp. CCTCC AB2023176]|uniref:LysR family transcriptional regulator n=1 Tax=Roseomonas sp. CCTCC AB2023176 TaxID=3342640 RepID=UPI0035DE529A
MDRDLLSHLPVMLAVARRRGFAAAASELGLSASNVSHSVRTVEERLGTPLFTRTTRSVALTAEGEAFVATLTPALQDIGAVWEQLRARKTGASGLLRINLSRVALPLAIGPVIAAMVERYPDVTVEAYIDDGLTDIVAAGFDAGVRLGEMIAEDMVAVRLTPPFQAIIAAAPSYLGRRGAPGGIADLAAHDCIGFRQIAGGGLYRWDLRENGRDVQADVGHAVIVNDPLSALDLGLYGVGLIYVFEPLVREHLAAGRLVQVLPEAAIEEPGLFLYFPRRAAMAPKLRAFIDCARDVLRLHTA